MKTVSVTKAIAFSCIVSLAFSLTACKKSSPDIVMPSVTTNAPTSITSTSAVFGANVTSLGNQDIQSRGFVIATNANPQYGPDASVSASGSGAGPYTTPSGNILMPNTVYHVRAFLSTTGGVAYGNDVSFTTLP